MQRRAVYKIGLEEVAECLIECTQERHRRRLALQTKKARMKLNATATQVNTYRQPGSHVQKGASFRFEAERKELTRLTEENGPTTQRLYQSVTDAHSELMGGDTVIQVMGGRCLEVLNNMREIRADQHEYLGETDLATTLTRRGLSEEIAIHKYEFKQDRERKRQVIEVRQVGTSELTANKSDACVKGLLVIVHMAGADAHCFLVKSDVHKSRGDWWNKYAEKVTRELTNEMHQLSWETHAIKKEGVEISDETISRLTIRGIPGREVSQTLAEALQGKQPSIKTKALIDFWDARTTEQKIIQLASGRHLRATLKALNNYETYAIVTHDNEGQDPMTATVYTDSLIGDKSCVAQSARWRSPQTRTTL